MRAICILWIICFWHLDDYLDVDFNNFWGNRFTIGCLATFVFISGYLLGDNIENFKQGFCFYKRRLVRIYPLFALSCLALYMMHISLGVDYILNLKQFILSLLGLACFFPPAPSTIWFINLIIVYYLLTPLIIGQKLMKMKIIMGIFIGFGIGILVSCLNADNRLAFYFPFYFFGIIFKTKFDISEKANIRLLVVSIAAHLSSGVITVFYGIDDKLFDLFTAAVLIVALFEIGKICNEVEIVTKFLGFISYGSMCAFLFHRVLLGCFYCFFKNTSVCFAYCVLLPVLFVASYMLQKLYNQVLNRRNNKKVN